MLKSMFIRVMRAKILLADPSLKPIIMSFTGHSLRITGANVFTHQGGSLSALKMLGDWKSEAYLLYLRLSLQDKVSASLQLGSAFR